MLYRVAQGLAWSLLGLSLSGCLRDVVTLSPEGENIKLVRQGDKPIDCDVVATVSGTSRSDDPKKALKGAENDMRNEAGKYEANFALVEIERTKNAGTGPYKEVFLSGKALQCTTLEMEAAAEKAEEERKAKEEQEAAERERQEQLDKEKAEAEKFKKDAEEKEKGDKKGDDEEEE